MRNNAMRVLAEITLHHPEIDVPIGPVLEALRDPAWPRPRQAGCAATAR